MPFTFGNQQKHVGSFRAEDLTLKAGGEAAALVQSCQFTCQRTVNMMYEIGTNNVYYVGNRRQGNVQLSRVIAASDKLRGIIKTYSDICDPQTLELDVSGDGGKQCLGSKRNYKMHHSLITALGASVQAQDSILTENMTFMFADLQEE